MEKKRSRFIFEFLWGWRWETKRNKYKNFFYIFYERKRIFLNTMFLPTHKKNLILDHPNKKISRRSTQKIFWTFYKEIMKHFLKFIFEILFKMFRNFFRINFDDYRWKFFGLNVFPNIGKKQFYLLYLFIYYEISNKNLLKIFCRSAQDLYNITLKIFQRFFLCTIPVILNFKFSWMFMNVQGCLKSKIKLHRIFKFWNLFFILERFIMKMNVHERLWMTTNDYERSWM